MSKFRSLGPASVFVEWRADPGLGEREMRDLLQCGSMCCDLYHVHLQECFFSETGSRQLCQFLAPDAESVRSALRTVRGKPDSIWTGRVYERRKQLSGNFIVEQQLNRQRRRFSVDMLDELGQEWGRQYRLELARAMISLDGKRAVFVCSAADADSIDRAVTQLTSTEAMAWPCRRLTAEAIATGEVSTRHAESN